MPSMAGQLADARNRARVSPSFREGGESLVAPPTGMPRTATPEEAPEEVAGYEPQERTPRGGEGIGGVGPSTRDTMAGPAGVQGMSAGGKLSAQLNPLKKIKVVGKVIRSLVPDQWLSWFSFDSWKDPVEIGLRLGILKIVFVVATLGLVIIVAMAAADALNPLN